MNDYRYDYEYLIHLIYCAIHDLQPDEKPEGISFENVFALGKEHEVANLAFLSVEKLESKPGGATYDEWKIFYYFSAERDVKQELEYQSVTELLHSNGIRTLEAQGTVMKTLYPSPELRMMSDIDFIVDFENIRRVSELLEEQGYSTEFVQDGELVAKNPKSGLELEFHAEFFTEYMYNRKERFSAAVNKPFDHSKSSDGLKYILDDTYFYLYSVLHTIKHFETAGCGIRRIVDLYYLKKAYEGKIDKELIEGVINANDFRKSYDALFAVEGFWFEDEKPESDLSPAISDIILSGNHGAGHIQTRNEIRRDREKGEHFVKLKRILNFIFPRKEYVYLGYPECRERGYSTVRCWIYRMYKTLRRFKFSNTKRQIRNILKSK